MLLEVREVLLDELWHCTKVLEPFLGAPAEEIHEDLAVRLLLHLTSAQATCLGAA